MGNLINHNFYTQKQGKKQLSGLLEAGLLVYNIKTSPRVVVQKNVGSHVSKQQHEERRQVVLVAF